ncbi:MAG: hypothetical protein WBX15_00490 [Thermoanaerobaculia bacterium]
MTGRLAVAALVLVALPLAGCANRQKRGIPTETIRAATPDAGTDTTDTDTALTQTVEIGDERSPNDGGVLTDPNAPTSTDVKPAAKKDLGKQVPKNPKE